MEGVRFEVPGAYRTLRVRLRVARWDLSESIWSTRARAITFPRCFPSTRPATPSAFGASSLPQPYPGEPARLVGIAPHLRALMADYAATGLPPAYLPKHDATDDPTEES